ncbi:MAG: enoyl-CoA hydratase/isomerase family protein [Cytophagales bacterium]|nr:enoyl-CoA hydratase/isomerase family protein [Cytophagales bacterium]
MVIAQVQGHALRGRLRFRLPSAILLAVPEAKFGYTEVRIGFIPALVAVFLVRKIGEQKARQLLLTGEIIKAEEAFERGLVTKLVSATELDSSVFDFAQNLIQIKFGPIDATYQTADCRCSRQVIN